MDERDEPGRKAGVIFGGGASACNLLLCDKNGNDKGEGEGDQEEGKESAGKE